MEKFCKSCARSKPLTDFYVGYGRCKECHKAMARAYYHAPENRERIVNYERRRSADPARIEKAKQYQLHRRIRDPQKYKARTAVGNALRDGRLFRGVCEVCASPNVQAHHDDYSQPLNVRWLCFKHHRETAHGQKVGV